MTISRENSIQFPLAFKSLLPVTLVPLVSLRRPLEETGKVITTEDKK